MFLLPWKRKVTANVEALKPRRCPQLLHPTFGLAKDPTSSSRTANAKVEASFRVLGPDHTGRRRLSRACCCCPLGFPRSQVKPKPNSPSGLREESGRWPRTAYNSRLLNEQWLVCRREYSQLEGGRRPFRHRGLAS